MRTIGLLGGMSWESTIPYYRHVNEYVREHVGGLHSAKIVLYSVDFQEVEEMQKRGAWDDAGVLLGRAAVSLVAAGAECIVLCTNTMHKVADSIEAALAASCKPAVPLLHIADSTAKAIKDYRADGETQLRQSIRCVGLLGTRFTMEQAFYKARLTQQHGLAVVIPNTEEDLQAIHHIIYAELCMGIIREASRAVYIDIMQKMVDGQGAECIILGCTEIALLVGDATIVNKKNGAAVPLFDTASIHARAAGEWALSPV